MTATATAQSSATTEKDGGGKGLVTYEESNGLSHGHATQIVQTQDGFLWIATWNGLNRFDGYEFQRMASQAGDGCNMPSDRIRDIWMGDDGNLYCQVDDELYLFNTATYRFSDVTDAAGRKRAEELRKRFDGRGQFDGQHITFTDRQGLLWTLGRDDVTCQRTLREPATLLPEEQHSQTRCLAADSKGRIWVMTKDDATIRLYDRQLHLLGYLTADGRLSRERALWPEPIYCMTETADGTIWMGSKPGGLYRLTETADGAFRVEHIGGLQCTNVYDIKEDRYGRLWLATLDGGIACVEHPREATPQIHTGLSLAKPDEIQRVRFIHLTADGILVATTTYGLLTARIEKDLGRVRFRHHVREANRPTSLGCNATMDVLEDSNGHLYISTESGGVLQVMTTDLTADTLSFSRCSMRGGWPTDVALSLTAYGERMLIMSNGLLTVYDPQRATGSAFDAWFFSHTYRFNETHPLLLADGRWLLPTNAGTLAIDGRSLQSNSYVPNIVLTGIAIQNGTSDLAVNELDTLVLSPTERNLTIKFAALDLSNAQRIKYAFRIGNDDASWNNIGHDHSVTLLDLKPGTYSLWLHSTNADGVWVDNMRRLTIIVRPTFWETPWAMVLLAAIALGIAGAVGYTLLYIRHIKRQRQETLEKYLALIQVQADQPTPTPETETEAETPTAAADDDPFMKRVVDFVEQNLGNADVSIGDMAEACAVSRSGLQRKMKQQLGVTPVDFIREARIKRACQLLSHNGASVSDVGYRCGFSDPKYFSRVFKTSTGLSPSEYKSRLPGQQLVNS